MEEAIKTYLENYAQEDIDFSLFYPHATKTIQGCCKYIENHYKKQAEEQARAIQEKDGSTEVAICKPVERKEVFAMAVRYFEDDTIEEFKEEEKPAYQPAPKPAQKPAGKEADLFSQAEEPAQKPAKNENPVKQAPAKKQENKTIQLNLF